jgi:hypothetical protein
MDTQYCIKYLDWGALEEAALNPGLCFDGLFYYLRKLLLSWNLDGVGLPKIIVLGAQVLIAWTKAYSSHDEGKVIQYGYMELVSD